MRTLLTPILAIFLLLTPVACSDDKEPGQLDQGVTVDSMPGTDSTVPGTDGPGPVADKGSPQAEGGSTKVDFGDKPLNCGEATLCSEACSKGCSGNFSCMMNCNATCKAKACESAKPLFDTVTGCTQTKCILACIGGPGTKCTECILDKCGDEVDTCNAHTC